jgi:hypothetical protein
MFKVNINKLYEYVFDQDMVVHYIFTTQTGSKVTVETSCMDLNVGIEQAYKSIVNDFKGSKLELSSVIIQETVQDRINKLKKFGTFD